MTTLKLDSQVEEERAEPEQSSAVQHEATLVQRGRALAIDMCPPLAVAAAAGAVSQILQTQGWVTLCWGVVAVSGLYFVANCIICQGRSGNTTGKYLEGLRTESASTGTPVGVIRAIIRFGCLPFDAIRFLLGRGWAHHRGQRRTFADHVVGSVVRSASATRPTDCRRRLSMAAAALVSLCAALALVLVQFFVQRVGDQELAAARETVAGVASDGAVAVLSYKPESVDQDFSMAEARLTGDFLASYTTLAKDVVGPTAKEKKVTMQASATGAAVESVTPDQASVLVYINQVTTAADNPQTTQSQNAIQVGLTRVDGAWLINQFEPLF